MPECGGKTVMSSYPSRNVFWVRCGRNIFHAGPHRETEAEALAAWNESPLRVELRDTELLLKLERERTAYLEKQLEAAGKDTERLDWLASELDLERAEIVATGALTRRSLFRKNYPITKAAIDAAKSSSDTQRVAP